MSREEGASDFREPQMEIETDRPPNFSLEFRNRPTAALEPISMTQTLTVYDWEIGAKNRVSGCSTSGPLAIVHFRSVGRL